MQGFLPGVECRARPFPWTTGESGRPLTLSSFLYLQLREHPDFLVVQGRGEHDTPHQGESLALLCGITDRRTGSEGFLRRNKDIEKQNGRMR